jgi:hypothetical protein
MRANRAGDGNPAGGQRQRLREGARGRDGPRTGVGSCRRWRGPERGRGRGQRSPVQQRARDRVRRRGRRRGREGAGVARGIRGVPVVGRPIALGIRVPRGASKARR